MLYYRKATVTEQEVFAVLATTYFTTDKGFVALRQVANSTGWPQSRTADAIAMQTWPSRGLHIHGIEIKCSRSDWVRELKKPAKADLIARFCHFWWIAVSDKKIVKKSELPETWGCLLIDNGTVRVLKKAPLYSDVEPVSYGFLAAILRRVEKQENRTDDDVRDIFEQGRRAGHKAGLAAGKKLLQQKFDHQAATTERLRETLSVFEKASGIQINEYTRNVSNLAAAVRFVMDGGIEAVLTSNLGKLRRLESGARVVADDVHALIDSMHTTDD